MFRSHADVHVSSYDYNHYRLGGGALLGLRLGGCVQMIMTKTMPNNKLLQSPDRTVRPIRYSQTYNSGITYQSLHAVLYEIRILDFRDLIKFKKIKALLHTIPCFFTALVSI